jgi:hypothetical protein
VHLDDGGDEFLMLGGVKPDNVDLFHRVKYQFAVIIDYLKIGSDMREMGMRMSGNK